MTVRISHYNMCESRQRKYCCKRPRPQAEQAFNTCPSPYHDSIRDTPNYSDVETSQELLTPSPQLKRSRVKQISTNLLHPSPSILVNETNLTLVTSHHRDEIVAALLTIVSALGLSKETLYMSVNLLDRYLSLQSIEMIQLETISITCLWIALKFMETPETIRRQSIKSILKQRSVSGHWTWSEIIAQEAQLLSILQFRLIAPTLLSSWQQKLQETNRTLTLTQTKLAQYCSDLFLLNHQMMQYSLETLVQALWFLVIQDKDITYVDPELLEPIMWLYCAHCDVSNPQHSAYKTWFALRCQYGPQLPVAWQLPYDPKCSCRVCLHRDVAS